MQSSSSKNLRIRSPSPSSKNLSKQSNKNSPNQKPQTDRKKQIQATLNQLHKLQSQIYNLNIPQNPHGSGPVKKQIKQLSYLYQNMTKPKVKNSINMDIKDIKSSLKIMNQGIKAIQIKNKRERNNINNRSLDKSTNNNNNQISLFQKSKINPSNPKTLKTQSRQQEQIYDQTGNKISSKTLKEIMKSVFNTEFDLSLISESKTQKISQLTADQIQKFINFNQHDNFDPLEQAYKLLLDENSQFSFKKYNEINQILGLPPIKQLGILKASLGMKQHQQMTFQMFKTVLEMEE